MVMGAESFILAGQTSFLSNATSQSWNTDRTYGSYIPQVDGLAYTVTKKMPKKKLTWDSQATTMAEWQELKGVGYPKDKREISASDLEAMRYNRVPDVMKFLETQSQARALSLYREAYSERSRKSSSKHATTFFTKVACPVIEKTANAQADDSGAARVTREETSLTLTEIPPN